METPIALLNHWICAAAVSRHGHTQRTQFTRHSSSDEATQLRTKIRVAVNARIDMLTSISTVVQSIASNADSVVTQWKREKRVEKLDGRRAPLDASVDR